MENHSSFILQFKNQQSEAIRTGGVLSGILSDEELYRPLESIKTTTTKQHTHKKNEAEPSNDDEIHVLNDEKNNPRSSGASSTHKLSNDDTRKTAPRGTETNTTLTKRHTTTNSDNTKNEKT